MRRFEAGRALAEALVAAAAVACTPTGMMTSGLAAGGGADGEGDCGERPASPPIDPEALPDCCGERGGRAHCIDGAFLAPGFHGMLAPCPDEGSYCVPDKFLVAGGAVEPGTCTSLRGAEGRCLSVCLPVLDEFLSFLPGGGCDADELCVPCVNPLTGEPTGACGLGTCGGAPIVPPDDGDDPATCEHEGKAVVNPSLLPACGTNAHCLEPEFLEPDFVSRLADCPGGGAKCVPDLFLRTGGKFVPPACRSLGNAEGRCLNTVLPEVAVEAERLPRASCGDGERCVPCFDPLDGRDTGACRQSCDPGPREPARLFPDCCGGLGRCVPGSVVPPESTGQLGPDLCPVDSSSFLCVPELFMGDEPVMPQACDAGEIWIIITTIDLGPGACLPACLPGVQKERSKLRRDVCPVNFLCAPCRDPLTGDDTGACRPQGGM